MNTLETAKNTGIVFIGEALIKIIDFFVVIFLAKYIGTSDFGTYSFVFAFIFLFNMLPTLGINKVLVREIAGNQNVTEKVVGNALVIRILLSSLAILLAAVAINALHYPDSTKILVYIASLTILFSSLRLTFETVFTAHLKMKYSEISAVAGKATSAFLVLLIIFLKGELIHIIIAITFSVSVDLLIIFIYFKKLGRPGLAFDIATAKKIFTASLPLALAIFVSMLYSKVDVIMLSIMKTSSDVGIYSAAFKLTESLNIIPMSIVASLFPLMTRYYNNSEKAFKSVYENGFRLMLTISLPMAVIVVLFSDNIIQFIFGSDFSKSSNVLLILICAEAFTFMQILFNNVAISMKKEMIIVYICLTMGIANILLNYLLIPQYSYIGASIATLATLMVGTLAFFGYIYTKLIRETFKITVLKIISANVLLYFFLNIFNFIPFIFVIFLAILFYLIIIIKLKLITEAEFKVFRGAFHI